jgi:hypothetical protein
MQINRLLLAVSLLGMMAVSCMQATKPDPEKQSSAPQGEKKLMATPYNSGFDLAHDTYNGISAASDGKIYYVLCSQAIDRGGQMYSFDPKTSKIQHLGDLTEACGEKDLKTIVQGKSHVRFFESDGKLRTRAGPRTPLPRGRSSAFSARAMAWRTLYPAGTSHLTTLDHPCWSAGCHRSATFGTTCTCPTIL